MKEDQAVTSVSGGLLPLVVTQALSAFNNNQLRGAMLTLLGLGGLKAFGLAPETIVALSTLLIVTPIFLFSLVAGRLADRMSKVTVIRLCKLLELAIFILVALALVTANGELLLASLCLAGLETAFFGPAKLGVLPEIVGSERLMAANAWMGASNTLAILLGLILGSVLLLLPAGVTVVAAMGVAIAALGVAAAFAIVKPQSQPSPTATGPRNIARDFAAILALCRSNPVLRLPLIGRSWFWYQGAITTSLMPLLPRHMPGQTPDFVAIVFASTAAGFCLGAFVARFLIGGRVRDPLALTLVFALIVFPAIDLPFAVEANQALRVLIDLFVLSCGTGIFLVPLNTVLQSETPHTLRAGLIGAGDTLSGFAMMLSGVTILGLEALSVAVPSMFTVIGVLTAAVAVVTLHPALPIVRALDRRRQPASRDGEAAWAVER